MPRNSRPGGIFGDMDFGWDNTTLNERIQAQNTWDLLNEQEQANKLSRQKLQQDKENNKILNDLVNNLIDTINTKNVKEDIRNNGIKEQQNLLNKQDMCNKLNIDYQDLVMFVDILDQPNKQILNQINTTQNLLENKTTEYNNLKSFNVKDKYNMSNLYRSKNELENKINELENKSFLFKLLNKKYINSQLQKYLSSLQNIENKINELNKEYNLNKNKLNKEKQQNLEKIQEEINNLQNKIDSLNNKYKLDRYNKYMNFIEFRKNHYNKEIELLFKKLNLPVFVIDYKDIKQEGTINDYKDYIATEILKGS